MCRFVGILCASGGRHQAHDAISPCGPELTGPLNALKPEEAAVIALLHRRASAQPRCAIRGCGRAGLLSDATFYYCRGSGLTVRAIGSR